MVKYIAVILCSLFVSICSARGGSDMSLYVGTQTGLTFPGMFRFTWGEVELGMYSSSIGVVKQCTRDSYYANFGLGISRQGKSSVGFVAGVGYHYLTSYMIGFKADWSTMAAVNGYLSTEPSLAITFNW